MKNKRIFIRCPNWLGDIVMAVPAINAVGSVFPGYRIAAYVRREYADILSRVAGVDDILPFEKKNVFAEARMAAEIRSAGFDMSIVLPNSWTSAIVPFIAGIPQRYGYAVRGRRIFFTNAIPYPAELLRNRHHVYHYLELIRSIRPGNYDDHPHLSVDDREKRASIEKLGLSGAVLCGFMPAAAYGEAKCWPAERYAKLGRRLVQKGYRVLLFGSPADAERCALIAAGIGAGAMNLAGSVPIADLPVYLAVCRFTVSNDSGPMHVSAAVGTPVVSIFGSTDPRATYPFGFKDLVIHRELDCSYCLDRECRRTNDRMRCMDLVTVDDVFETIEHLESAW